jgi:single-strand DNA-binding protein
MNVCTLIGNLGADAEVKVFGDGQAVLNFSLATSEKWTDKKTGEKKEKTEWHRLKYFTKGAANLAPYLTKGSKVAVQGSIQYGTYEKDGVKMYSTDIKVDRLELLGSKNQSSQANDPDDDGLPPPGDNEIPF